MRREGGVSGASEAVVGTNHGTRDIATRDDVKSSSSRTHVHSYLQISSFGRHSTNPFAPAVILLVYPDWALT
jgi:hypothetical protein